MSRLDLLDHLSPKAAAGLGAGLAAASGAALLAGPPWARLVAGAAVLGGGALLARSAGWVERRRTPDATAAAQETVSEVPFPTRSRLKEVQWIGVHYQLHRLVESPARRVVAMVLIGEPSYPLVASSELLEADLGRRSLLHFERRAVRFPGDKEDLEVQIPKLLYDALGHDAARRLEDSLDAVGPGGDGDGPRILWLDWGGFGCSEGLEAPLNVSALRAWLAVCENVLAAHCPPGLSVLCTLAVETAHRDRVEMVVDLHMRGEGERFACYTLPLQNQVAVGELRDYLTNSGDTGIDLGLVDRAAEVLHREADGDYASLLRLIERGERDGWTALLAEIGGSRQHNLEL